MPEFLARAPVAETHGARIWDEVERVPQESQADFRDRDEAAYRDSTPQEPVWAAPASACYFQSTGNLVVGRLRENVAIH